VSEFPEKLIERCAEKALQSGDSDRGWVGVTEAILRESGHSGLVAAAKIGLHYAQEAAEDLDSPSIESDVEEIRAALKKAGAL